MTRDRLLGAAYKLYASGGIEGTPIDRIAEEAGYSRGAFYSNFETKEELLKALVEWVAARSEADFAEIEGTSSTPEDLVRALRDYALNMTSNRRECMFYLELELYAVRNPEARTTVCELMRRDVKVAGGFLDRLFAACGVTDHPPSEIIVSSFIAMAQGLTMRQVVDSEMLSEQVVRDSLMLYFDSVITKCIPQLRKSGSG